MNIDNPQIASFIRSLPSIEYRHRDELPGESGVYLVIVRDEVLYVGACKSLYNRFYSENHHRKPQFDLIPDLLIAWMPLPLSSLRINEKRMIERFDPLLNELQKKGANKHEELHRNFKIWLRTLNRRNGKRKR